MTPIKVIICGLSVGMIAGFSAITLVKKRDSIKKI